MSKIAVILAGGLGTRLSEETVSRPKPMVEIGGMPILWHIMKIYSFYGVNKFIICCGYKGYLIKEYFANYFLHTSDITVNLKENSLKIHRNAAEPWEVTLVDTGLDTMTGGRLKRIKPYVANEKSFFMTYGDGVANINIVELLAFHEQSNNLATLTAVLPPGRFGAIEIDNAAQIRSFREKPNGEGAYINGGYFVLSPQTLDYIADDQTIWEKAPLETLAAQGQLGAFVHQGFWQPMDTLRDKHHLENLWENKMAPWKLWS